MATKQSTIDFLLDQLARLDGVSARKMFGEFAIYVDGKIVGLVCDDSLFLKPTAEVRLYLGENCAEEPPYPSAKPHLVVDEERWEDDEWMCELFRVAAAALPLPVKKGAAPKKAATEKTATAKSATKRPAKEVAPTQAGAPHPYQDDPTPAQLKRTLTACPAPLRELYLGLHALVVEVLPDVKYSLDLKDGMLGYGAHQYGANGWGVAALAFYSKWVSLGFLQGAALPDPKSLLEGSGKSLRHVKIRSAEELKKHSAAICALVKAASKANR